ncbi:MAG: hypothetical protein LC799_06385 [Actinobacteria bacterium]|nr:hypothetical protein [Actinomycetota bacterium]
MDKRKSRGVFADGPDETFRATVRGRTPEGDFTTLIVLRRGLGRAGRVWLTFDGAIKTTVVMTDPETAALVGLLGEAQDAG